MGFLPLHPALVHLPISFVLLSVVADFCARRVKFEPRRASFRTVGFWSLVAALAGGALAVAAGYWDAGRDSLRQETAALVEFHETTGWILIGGLAWLSAWRWLLWHRGQITIPRAYLSAGIIVLLMTFFQGWYGGEMVYSYGAGVAPVGQGTESASSAQKRLATIENLLGPSHAMGGGESPGGTNQSGESVNPPRR